MAKPRGTVTIGSLDLVVDIAQYQPFGDAALGVRVFDGVDATTIQDFGFRADRQQGTLASGTGTSAGLVSKAQLAALLDLVRAWGASQPLADHLGNAGTVKAVTFAHKFEYGVPGAQDALFSYTLGFRWVTLTSLYGAPYTGR